MAHNLWSNRFYNRSTTPAWHGLGINRIEDWSAEEALREVGIYHVEKTPLYLPSDGGYEQSGVFLLRRAPTPDDPVWRNFGDPVTVEYELIDPISAARLWDQNVCADGKPVAVETVGVMGKGEHIFITTKLPSIDVKGDQVDNYLIYNNPLEARNAVGVHVANIRVVCQNTLRAALQGATQAKTISHSTGATDFLAHWLRTIYENALLTVSLMQTEYTNLAETPVTLPQVKWIIEKTYPLPKKPQAEDRSRQDLIDRMVQYERNLDLVKRIREATLNCYQGAGQGADTPAANGTAWGAWQAVAEMETFRRGKLEKVAEQLIVGERAQRMRNAFTLAKNVSVWDRVDVRSLGLKRVRA